MALSDWKKHASALGYPGPPPPMSPPVSPGMVVASSPWANAATPSLETMIASRFHKTSISELGFDHIYPIKINGRASSKVVVVVVPKGSEEAVIVEDDWGLFPSDAFITKLRLLQQES